MSAKEIIEQTLQAGEREMQWLRGKPGELFEWVIRRTKFSTEGHGLPHPEFRSRIHTHICAVGTPSGTDLNTILTDIGWSNIRNWHIVSLDEKGNIKGYFSMHATRKMLEAVKNSTEEERKLLEKITIFICRTEVPKDKKVQIKAELMEEIIELGLSIRSVPMEGYFFDGKRFIKK